MGNKGFWVTLNGRYVHIQGDQNMSDDDLEILMKMVEGLTNMDLHKDLAFECSMCGKPMEYRYCGMCTHCEMVFNE